VPCFYTHAYARILYLNNLSVPHPGNFTGPGISSRLKEHKKQRLAEIKRRSNQNNLKNKKYVRSKNNKPENKNYVKNQASKNSGTFEKYKEGDIGSTLFVVLTG
jgi:hypothetical protein